MAPVYSGNLTISGIPYKVSSCFAETSLDMHAEHLLKTCSIAFVVSTKTKTVFIRTALDCHIPAYKIAQKLFEGGGIDHIAVGKMNANFLEISKSLKPTTIFLI